MGRERREFGSIRKLVSGRHQAVYTGGPSATRGTDHFPGEN